MASHNHFYYGVRKRRGYLIAFVLGCIVQSYAFEDIETARTSMITLLEKHNPDVLRDFHGFCHRYNQLVFDFFDKKNNDPLEAHIKYMETNANILQHVCNDLRFQSVRSFLITRYEQVLEMIKVLKKYKGSHDTLTLAFRLKKFKFLLPYAVKKRGDISLFWSLHHRLRCK